MPQTCTGFIVANGLREKVKLIIPGGNFAEIATVQQSQLGKENSSWQSDGIALLETVRLEIGSDFSST